MALNDKQQRFVEEYLIDLNATQAAIRAGYSPDTAYSQGQRLLKNDEVGQMLDEAKLERSEATKIDANYVLRQATILHERCMQTITPVTDRRGNQIYDGEGAPLYEFNAAGAAKALELIGKHIHVSAFEERIKHSGTMGITVLAEDADL